MKSLTRIIGWLLFLGGSLLSIFGMADLAGLMALPIDFGFALTSKDDMVLWVITWLVAAVVGLMLAKPGGKREAH